MPCKGICIRFKGKKRAAQSWYVENNRCNTCSIFIAGKDKLNCPCCGYRLRNTPRNGKYKELVKEIVRI